MNRPQPRVAVVGGGINGSGAAWELARREYAVTLFEKDRCGAATSSKTTKMIHGGLRYLERLHLGVVRESLRERAWLLEHLPSLVKPLEILLPMYEDAPRHRLTVRAGLLLYDLLSGRENIAPHRVLGKEEMLRRLPLRAQGLRGGFSYWDAQVDDLALVRTVVESARREGAVIREGTAVHRFDRAPPGWRLRTSDGEEEFDFLINAAGPWMNEYLVANGVKPPYRLSLIRGSHIVSSTPIGEAGALLQSVDDARVFFVLPWKGGSLIGTTEAVHRTSLDDVQPSEEEIAYLRERYDRTMREPLQPSTIVETFAGVRPLVGRASNPGSLSRDYRLVRRENVIHIFGGKLTTFMALSRKVAMRVDNYFGRPRQARPPVFAAV